MTNEMKALVVLDDRVDRTIVETLLTSSRQMEVHDFVDLEGHDPAHDGAGDVAIVACSEFTGRVGEYVKTATRLHPGRPLLVLCSHPTNGYLAEAMYAGAEDILTIPGAGDLPAAKAMGDEMVAAALKAVARRRGATAKAGTELGSLICVLGLKGGSGKTLTSTNLAVALAGNGARVAVIDLDLQFGDVGLALGLSPERTVYDLVRSGGSLDAEKVEDFLAVHPSGVRALLAPARPDEAGVVTPAFLNDLYPLLRQMHDFVIVDTPPSFTPEVISAVDSSDEVCMVAMLDALSLKNTKVGLETLELMAYRGRVRVVLNRADSQVGIAREDVVAVLGRSPDVLIPEDRHITRAVNQGEPIVSLRSRSAAARSFQALAHSYATPRLGGEQTAQRRRVSLWKRGSRRR